jgi:hypothetical protein
LVSSFICYFSWFRLAIRQDASIYPQKIRAATATSRSGKIATAAQRRVRVFACASWAKTRPRRCAAVAIFPLREVAVAAQIFCTCYRTARITK